MSHGIARLANPISNFNHLLNPVQVVRDIKKNPIYAIAPPGAAGAVEQIRDTGRFLNPANHQKDPPVPADADPATFAALSQGRNTPNPYGGPTNMQAMQAYYQPGGQQYRPEAQNLEAFRQQMGLLAPQGAPPTFPQGQPQQPGPPQPTFGQGISGGLQGIHDWQTWMLQHAQQQAPQQSGFWQQIAAGQQPIAPTRPPTMGQPPGLLSAANQTPPQAGFFNGRGLLA